MFLKAGDRMTVKIITDSGCDLPQHTIDEYDIDMMPLLVILDGDEYEDNKTIKAKELYDLMRKGKVPKTAQVPSHLIKETFEQYAKENTSCIYIGFSSELSGTYGAAEAMKNEILETYPDFDMECVDTKCASMGQGLVVANAVHLQREGKTKEEILEKIHFDAQHMEHIFTVDNLEYLFRGGRVSRASAFMGSLLKIKPILNVENGSLVPIEKVRGRNKVFTRIVDLIGERGVDLKEQVIGISHADDPRAADKLKGMIKKRFGTEHFVVSMVGSVIGSHAGPGTLAVFFLNKRQDS
jgi:DegV family protein with EDD domain